jgi:multiple sugar transport system substrate-binding protein
MAIPKTASAKEWSWNLMRDLSSKQNTVIETINGNGPVRGSAFSDPRIVHEVPYAAIEAQAVKAARVPLPAFPKAAQAKDVCVEEMQAAMLDMKTPEQAAKSMARRLRLLMPA